MYLGNSVRKITAFITSRVLRSETLIKSVNLLIEGVNLRIDLSKFSIIFNCQYEFVVFWYSPSFILTYLLHLAQYRHLRGFFIGEPVTSEQ